MKTLQINKHFLVTTAIIAGLFFRIQKIGINFHHDEAYTVMAVKGILKQGYPVFESGLVYIRAIVFTYLNSIIPFFFGIHEWTIRTLPLLIGLVSMYVVYRIIAKETIWAVGAVTLVVIAFSPWHATYSLFSRSYMLQSLLFFLSLYFVNKYCLTSIKKNKIRYLLSSAICAILTGSLTPFALLCVPCAVIIIGVHGQLKKSLKWLILYSALVSVNFFIPFAYVPWEKLGGDNGYSLLSLRSLVVPNIFFWKELFIFSLIGGGIIIASAYILRNHREYFGYSLSMLFILIFLSIFNPFENLQPRYLANLMILYYVLVSLSAYVLSKDVVAWIRSKKITKSNFFNKQLNRHYIVITLSAVLIFASSDLHLIPSYLRVDVGRPLLKTMQISLSWDTMPDTKSAVEYVNAHSSKNDIIISLQPRGQTEVYLNRKLNYLLRTKNYESESHLNAKGVRVDDYSAIPLITSADGLKKVLTQGGNARIWIVSSKSEKIELDHIDQDSYNQLLNYAQIVYKGNDEYSKVYKGIKNSQ